jgi:hypothetical protein
MNIQGLFDIVMFFFFILCKLSNDKRGSAPWYKIKIKMVGTYILTAKTV